MTGVLQENLALKKSEQSLFFFLFLSQKGDYYLSNSNFHLSDVLGGNGTRFPPARDIAEDIVPA